MAQMIGADPEQLDALGCQMTTSADRLDSIRSEIGSLLNHSHWEGADADDFRGTWHHRLSGLLNAAALATRDVATTLRINADQQRDASKVGGCSAGRIHAFGSFLTGTVPIGSVHEESYSTGRVDPGGQWRLGYADADVNGLFGLNSNLVGAGLSASAALGLAAYRRQDSFTVAGRHFDSTFDASIGARASGDGFVGLRDDHGRVRAGASIGGTAFAGLEAHESIGTKALGEAVGLQAYGSAHAGAGVDGGATAMIDDGKLVLGAHLGASVGLGVSGGFEVSVDVEKLGEYGGHAIDGTVRFTEGAMDGLHDGWDGFWSSLDH